MRPMEDDQPARGWNSDDDVGGLGPQGEALILELQRLRQALDDERANGQRRGRRSGREGARKPPQPQRKPQRQARRPKRKRKSRMGQAIDICLKPFGLVKTSSQGESRREVPIEPVVSPPRWQSPPIAPIEPVPPPRWQSPPIAPSEPIFMDLTKPGPEMSGSDDSHRSTVGERALSVLLRPAKPEIAAGLIDKCRTNLMAGVAFILDRDGAEPPNGEADDNLLVRARWAFEHELRVGLRILILAAVVGGGWFAFVPLAGAVVVPGNLVVQSNVKQIQHPTGGVIAEIKAQNGSRVEAGDLLVRLDATQAQTSLQVVTKQLDEVRARMARLIAERDGLAQIEFPAELPARSGEGNVKSLLASEESLFKARSSARKSQKELLQSQIAQLTQEISGLEAQVDSKAKQLELIQTELSGVQELYDKRLVPLTRLTSLQREAARIDGERGQLMSSIAETKSKIDASRLQIVRIDQDFRTEVVKDLNDAQSKEAELVERSVAARDLLDRIEIRAPTTGAVNQLSVHTIGGVIKAGETIMEIVPDTDDLQIEAHVQPKDIDHVKTGQTAFVRLTAFNQRTTPQLNGTVTYVSADTGHDQQTNAPSYTVRVLLPEEERRRLNGQQLVPGMPAEVFVQTGGRSMMSYLFEPISDQMRRAFVE
jgi:HlyD family secretion protein